MEPIKINGRDYYYYNFYDTSRWISSQHTYNHDYTHTSFYKKGENIKESVTTRKYWIFGEKSTKIVEVENFIHCFDTNQEVDQRFIFDQLKETEEKYFTCTKNGILEI